MKIYIPRKFKDTHWSEGQAILLSFMYVLAELHGWDETYNMHSKDLKTIIGYTTPSVNTGTMYHLKQAFEIAQLNDWNWTFKWKDYDEHEWRSSWYTKDGGRNISTSLYVLKKTRSIAMWSFLMGRIMDPNIINDTNKILPHSEPESALPDVVNKNFNFR